MALRLFQVQSDNYCKVELFCIGGQQQLLATARATLFSLYGSHLAYASQPNTRGARGQLVATKHQRSQRPASSNQTPEEPEAS